MRRIILVALVLVPALALGGWWWLRPLAPDELARRGREAIAAGRWDDAELAAAALESAGRTDPAAIIRGESLYRRGQFLAAIRQLNTVRDTGLPRVEAAALSGCAQFRVGNIREANRVLRFVVAEDAGLPVGLRVEARRTLAVIAYDQGDLPGAAGLLEEVSQLDREDGRPSRLLGLIRKDLDRPAEAATAYREALARQLPDDAQREARLELAEVLLKTHAFAEAADALAGLTGPDADALAIEAAFGSGGPDAARRRLASATSPDDPRILRWAGRLKLEAGDTAGAAADLMRAATVGPPDLAGLTDLARALEAAGQPRQAADARQRADELRAIFTEMTTASEQAAARLWDPAPRRRLADLCRRAGRLELATRWEQAADACPAGPP